MPDRTTVCLLLGIAVRAAAQNPCPELSRFATFAHAEIGAIELYRAAAPAKALLFVSQMQVNTDGAPDSYHPDNLGITHLCNGLSVGAPGRACVWKPDCLADFRKARAAGFTGDPKICFFAMVTTRDGRPVLQKEGDPKPGYYISTTALKSPGKPADRPEAQLDSNAIPFVVIPGKWNRRFEDAGLGDVAAVYRKSNGRLEFAVVGDTGPNNKLGEGSVALHLALGNDPFVTRSGVRRAGHGIGGRDVVYLLFPGSRSAMRAFTAEAIRAEGRRQLEAFGGEAKLKECAAAAR